MEEAVDRIQMQAREDGYWDSREERGSDPVFLRCGHLQTEDEVDR